MVFRSPFWWKNRFTFTLLVSLILHGIFLWGWSRFGPASKTEEIEYQPVIVRFQTMTEAADSEISGELEESAPLFPEQNEQDHLAQETHISDESATEMVFSEEDEEVLAETSIENDSSKELFDSTESTSEADDMSSDIDNTISFDSLTRGLELPLPRYPDAARRWGFEGVVTLEIKISSEGEVAGVELLESSGYPLLDQEVIRTVSRKWTFLPPGQAVTIIREFEFSLRCDYCSISILFSRAPLSSSILSG